MIRDRGIRAEVKVWPQWLRSDGAERRIITIGHGNYSPSEARDFAEEILRAVAEGEALLIEPSAVPDGWEKCEGIGNCPDAGKWGAGVDPHDHTVWHRWHAWHQANAFHGFTIHQVRHA
jgi:hypothetical protein